MRENRTSGSESGDWKRDRGAGLRPEAKATEVPPCPRVESHQAIGRPHQQLLG